MRDKENTDKPKVVIEPDGDKWVVRNEGDSAVLFTSDDEESAQRFAEQMAEYHNVELDLTATEPTVSVERDGECWVVKHLGDSAILFSSDDREAAEKFAREMSQHHAVNLKVDGKTVNPSEDGEKNN